MTRDTILEMVIHSGPEDWAVITRDSLGLVAHHVAESSVRLTVATSHYPSSETPRAFIRIAWKNDVIDQEAGEVVPGNMWLPNSTDGEITPWQVAIWALANAVRGFSDIRFSSALDQAGREDR
jgi:hypothetical protein